MLNKTEYATLKVRMMMFLEVIDYDYLDKIHDGPYIPRKLIPTTLVNGINQPEYYAVKEKPKWT